MTLGWAAAIPLGIVLVLSGALKLAGRDIWRSQARTLGLPRLLIAGMPVLELVLGALLVVNVARRDAAVVAALLLVAFTYFLLRLLLMGRHPPCACFGALSRDAIGWGSIVRNLVLLGLATVAALAA